MKKALSILICLLLVVSLAIPALATTVKVTFTSNSLAEVGGTLSVDKNALMDNGNITSDMYNALLEGNLMYSWYKNGMLTQEGIGTDALSYALSASDLGCTIYVEVSFYEDSSFQESKKCGTAVSDEVTITGAAPEITTKALPAGTVGSAYYVRLECSDPDAVFSEIMGSQLSEFGLYLTQHGEIEGTPTKSGNCHVNILAVSEGGGETSDSFDITIRAAETQPQQTTPATTPEELPETTPQLPSETAPAATEEIPAPEVTEPRPADVPSQEQAPAIPDETPLFPWWGYVLIILSGITTGIGIAFIIIKLKKKA